MRLSAVVLTKNEEANIKDCLSSLSWCDEMVVVDDYSSDNTFKIAKAMGAFCYQRNLADDFAAQRNFGMGKARGEWIIFVDADERVGSLLRKEIIQKINKNEYQGFFLRRNDYFGGRCLKYGETGRVRLLRLGRKDSGQWERRVHETWQIKGKTSVLKEPLSHYPHQSLKEFFAKINRYSELHAHALGQEGRKANLLTIIFFPFFKFCQNYFLKLGFLDGLPGFIMAMTMSFHSFLAQSKLYLLT